MALVTLRSSTSPLSLLRQLNQVAAGILQHSRRHRAHRHRRLRERHTQGAKTFVLGLQIVHAKRRERNSVVQQCVFEWAYSGMTIGLQQELRAIAVTGCNYRKPFYISQ